jgi:ADP-heptose:LPS heptosyltransferase
VLEQLPPGARVLIIRLRSLGDCVLTTPAIQILQEARPDLVIAMVVEDRFRDVFSGNPRISAIVPPRLGAAAAFRPLLAINLHGGTRSVWLTLASRARWRAGFAHYRNRWAYNFVIPRAQEILGVERTVHTAEHLASAILHLGALRREIPPARLYATPHQQGTSYAVLHPMASAAAKTWPAERFAALATGLQSRGIEPVFIAASGEDMTGLGGFRCMRGAPLEQIKNLLAGAALFVGNDSGPAHMAAALAIPAVVLFGDSDPVVWAPWKSIAEQIIASGRIDEIPVDRVLEAVDRVLVRA